jgi:hypothetical protein
MQASRISFILLAFCHLTVYSQQLPVLELSSSNLLKNELLSQRLFFEQSSIIFPLDVANLTDSAKSRYARQLNTNENLILSILSPFWISQFSEGQPYLRNNRALKFASGYQQELSVGLFAQWKWLKLQIRPSWILGNLANFQTYLESDPGGQLPDFSIWANRIDRPEQIQNYRQVLLGDSYISFNIFKTSIGYSSQNLWWGPGKYNSLILTNNASGFNHFFVQTEKPIETLLGSLEYSLIVGRLGASGQSPFIGNAIVQQQDYVVDKGDEIRFFNGFAFIYKPRWVPGLELGYLSSSQSYDQHPYLSSVLTRASQIPNDARSVVDRQRSYFINWQLPNTRFYFEQGNYRDDFRFLDLFEPDQKGNGTIAGLERIQPMRKNTHMRYGIEVSYLQQQALFAKDKAMGWFTHPVIRHGYTNEGQLLSAGIGPGSNLLTVAANYSSANFGVGTRLERLVHNKDFYFYHFPKTGNFYKWWVDYSLQLNGYFQFTNMLLSYAVTGVQSINQHWSLGDSPPDIPFPPGNDLKSIHGQLSVEWLFN